MEKIKKALELARQSRNSTPSGKNETAPVQSLDEQSETRVDEHPIRTIHVDMVKLREKRVILGDERDAVSTVYKLLRTHVLQRLKTNQWNTLAITSPTEGNGKTLTAINLAISLARNINHTVLLADMDLRRPTLHHYFCQEKSPGISEYLTDGVELNEVLINPGIERLLVLPGSKSFTNSSEMLSSPQVVNLVKQLKTQYHNCLIIFDMPPLLSCDDVFAFSPFVDAFIMVVEEGRTRKDDLKRAHELMAEMNIIGTILNKSVNKVSTYGYY